ncbi:hypothetical protein LCGC14_1295070 [marine sediment metagenome]|uniref:Uncharacterized protein n=1 Tax=marine sediment metagenome TaxID=412755 RepID=A0A0F9KT24_9ZZZZ
MTTEELVKHIAELVSNEQHMTPGGGFLYPPELQPPAAIYVPTLFDHLAEYTGISKEQIGAWYNAQQELNERISRGRR